MSVGHQTTTEHLSTKVSMKVIGPFFGVTPTEQLPITENIVTSQETSTTVKEKPSTESSQTNGETLSSEDTSQFGKSTDKAKESTPRADSGRTGKKADHQDATRLLVDQNAANNFANATGQGVANDMVDDRVATVDGDAFNNTEDNDNNWNRSGNGEDGTNSSETVDDYDIGQELVSWNSQQDDQYLEVIHSLTDAGHKCRPF